MVRVRVSFASVVCKNFRRHARENSIIISSATQFQMQFHYLGQRMER